MVKSLVSEMLDRTFTALSDPTRRSLLAAVADGPRTVGVLAAPLPMSLAAVSKHISVLERAGLVTRTRSGRNQVCELNPAPLRTAAAWLSTYHRFWTTKLDALERYVGGRYRIDGPGAGMAVSGEYVSVEPPNRLAFTWRWDGETEETLVTLELVATGDGTRLALTHERFSDDADRDNHAKGWSDCLDRLPGWLAR